MRFATLATAALLLSSLQNGISNALVVDDGEHATTGDRNLLENNTVSNNTSLRMTKTTKAPKAPKAPKQQQQPKRAKKGTSAPTGAPSLAPTSSAPTSAPSLAPTSGPTASPTLAPTVPLTFPDDPRMQISYDMVGYCVVTEPKTCGAEMNEVLEWFLNEDSSEDLIEVRSANSSEDEIYLKERLAIALIDVDFDGVFSEGQPNWLSKNHHHCDWMGQSMRRRLRKEYEEIVQLQAGEEIVRRDQRQYEGYFCHEEEDGSRFVSAIAVERKNLAGLSIPTHIGSFSKLEYLDLSANGLVGEIPTEIAALTSLEDLYLYSNSITSIPTEIATMNSLEQLIVHDNSLTSIPTEIATMNSLGVLTVHSNDITEIPAEFAQFNDEDMNLELLTIFDNNITDLPYEFVTSCSQYNNNEDAPFCVLRDEDSCRRC